MSREQSLLTLSLEALAELWTTFPFFTSVLDAAFGSFWYSQLTSEHEEEEDLHFKQKWEEDYFFAEISSKAVCLICQQSVAALKEYNIRRYYKSKHAVFPDTKVRRERKKSPSKYRSQQATLTRPSTAQDCATRASYEISALIAKSGRSFSTGDFVKECLLSHKTVTCRIEDSSRDIRDQLINTDISDSPGMKTGGVELSQNYARDTQLTLLKETHHQSRAAIWQKRKKGCIVSWDKMVGITTDGAPAMIGKKAGLPALVSQKVSECGGKVAQYHCILHHEQLCAKTIGLADVVRDVVKVINCIRSKALSHRQFRAFLDEVDAQYKDILYHPEVRWLSRGQLITEFLLSASMDTQIPSDKRWIFDVAFMVDITDLNNLNVKLQQTELFDQIKAFKKKLQLLCRHLSAGNLAHFPSLREVNEFDIFFLSPFIVSPDLVPEHLQMELIEFQCDKELRRKFVSLPLRDFYPHVSVQRYPQMRKNAQVMLSQFGSIYICEQTFSLMNLNKIKLTLQRAATAHTQPGSSS
uniref:SPIN-DOC-like zinc-finger domain-containing protein n=1 Tax=Oryzias latipes TaxID=8090 RepID=A0A3P9LX64_ORYLA